MGLCTRAAPVALLATALAIPACAPEERATLVPLQGCGIEGEVDGLRLTARGDFPPASAPAVVFREGTGELVDLPSSVAGVTVEGLFGPSPVAVGRTARLQAEGLLPVYFSEGDGLCPVESEIPERTIGAMAVGGHGDVVVVGGRGLDFELVKDVLHYRDSEGELRVGVGELPFASIGQTVHRFGNRRFLVVGGTTGVDQTLARAFTIDVGADEADVEVGETLDLDVAGAVEGARAYHGGVVLDDGRILIVGGCQHTIGGECSRSEESVLRSAFFVEPSGRGITIDANVPPLLRARFGHQTLVSRDGIIFVVGGFGPTLTGPGGESIDSGVETIELLLPGLASWAPYGPALTPLLAGRDIVGATLLEGGQIVFALSDGTIWSVDEFHVWQLRNWCGGEGTQCFLQTGTVSHTLLALPGERVLADNFLLPVSQLARDGFGAIDVATDSAPGARAGSQMRLLDDGSVLIGGGVVPASGAVPAPILLRFRPALDGPDERQPVLGELPAGSLILHDDPGDGSPDVEPRIRVEDNGLLMSPDPQVPDSVVGTWVHVRAFLSRRFRFQATIDTTQDPMSLERPIFPAFVFSGGAIARNTMVVRPTEVRFIVREPSGSSFEIGCASEGLDFVDTPRAVVVQVSPEAVELRHDGRVVARCPWAGDDVVSVGLGAVGAGTMRARSLGLSRG